VPLKLTLPPDIDRRLAGLGDAIGASSDDVLFAYVFGSAARGSLTPASDVDVAIYVAPGADAHRVRLVVARVCAKHLGTDAVDVVLLNGAPVSLAGRVLTSRRVLFERDPFARHRYESRHARMFQDFRIREHRLIKIGADRSTLSPGAPVALFPTRFPTGANITIGWLSKPQYAVAPDGRFLMNVTVEDTAASPITIVQNWQSALTAREK